MGNFGASPKSPDKLLLRLAVIGPNSVCHNCVGHHYLGHGYVSHNYRGRLRDRHQPMYTCLYTCPYPCPHTCLRTCLQGCLHMLMRNACACAHACDRGRALEQTAASAARAYVPACAKTCRSTQTRCVRLVFGCTDVCAHAQKHIYADHPRSTLPQIVVNCSYGP